MKPNLLETLAYYEEGDALVVLEGEVFGVEYPIARIRDNVRVDPELESAGHWWRYDPEQNAIVAETFTGSGVAAAFIAASNLDSSIYIPGSAIIVAAPQIVDVQYKVASA